MSEKLFMLYINFSLTERTYSHITVPYKSKIIFNFRSIVSLIKSVYAWLLYDYSKTTTFTFSGFMRESEVS